MFQILQGGSAKITLTVRNPATGAFVASLGGDSVFLIQSNGNSGNATNNLVEINGADMPGEYWLDLVGGDTASLGHNKIVLVDENARGEFDFQVMPPGGPDVNVKSWFNDVGVLKFLTGTNYYHAVQDIDPPALNDDPPGTETVLTFDGSSGWEVGDVIKRVDGSEQMLITAKSDNIFTVQRGYNDTTPEAIAAGAQFGDDLLWDPYGSVFYVNDFDTSLLVPGMLLYSDSEVMRVEWIDGDRSGAIHVTRTISGTGVPLAEGTAIHIIPQPGVNLGAVLSRLPKSHNVKQSSFTPDAQSATSIQFDDVTGWVAGMILTTPDAAEIMKIVSISSTTLTVLRGYANTSPVNLANHQTWRAFPLPIDVQGDIRTYATAKKAQTFLLHFVMTDATTHQLSSPAAGDITIKVSKDGGAFATQQTTNGGEAPAAVSGSVSGGQYKLTLSKGDTNAGVVVVEISAAGCDTRVERILVSP